MNNYRPSGLIPALAAALLLAGTAIGDSPGVQSLRGTDVGSADQAPEEKAYVGRRPGSQQPIARTFEQQPPLVPHAMTNFDEITPADNQCMECHGPDTYQKKNAPKLGDSHFRDPATGTVQATVSGARYQCTLCHVPQVDAEPLVENAFQGVPFKPKPK
jgi:cytochrome c-type protein NapB